MEERVAIYLLKRTALLAVVLVLGATFVFAVLFVIPEDPVNYFIPKGLNEQVRQDLIEELRLNDPLLVQYINFMVKCFTGDFFPSSTYLMGVDIESFIYRSLSATLGLYMEIAIVGCVLGALLEQAISRLRNASLRTAGHGLAFLILGAPIGGLSLLLLLLIAKYDLPFPLRGGHLIPFLAGAIATCAGYILIASRPYKERPDGARGIVVGMMDRILSLLSIPERRATLLAFSAWIMIIVLVIEVVFSRHGLGLLFYESLLRHDFALAMSTAFVLFTSMAVIQFATDVSWTLVLRQSRIYAKRTEQQSVESRTPIPENESPNAVAKTVDPDPGLVSSILKVLTGSWRGRLALCLFVAMMVIALGAPWLSTVRDPNSYSSLEQGISYSEWRNPLPPSFDRSPYTGYMHPFGTDHIGRDIYSLVLYGFMNEFAAAAVIIAIAILAGIANSILAFAVRDEPGFPSSFLRAGASALSWSLLAIPLLGGLIVIDIVTGESLWKLSTIALIAAWAWALQAMFLLGKTGRRTSTSSHISLTDDLRANASGILHVSKLVFLFTYLSIAALAFIGLSDPDVIYWGNMLGSAFDWGAFVTGAWWWVVPPMAASILLCASFYVILDTMEKTAEAYRKQE